MRISPNYTAAAWKALQFSSEDDWQEAIKIFEDRMRGRFLDLVDMIEHRQFAGFTVLAIDCLLIETLQQFREGKPETPRSQSGDYFIRFLTTTSFGKHFTANTADMFYRQIRCGILHQAEVKKSSRIRIASNLPLVKLTPDGKGLIVRAQDIGNRKGSRHRKQDSLN
jgi:hypothetical protein